ncbi:MAG: flagellar filament capping protein FliD [Lachnospiraceae bacterium]|nr:flagellar filament capping protein FliD [Lachnospiraceae bacterium]
MAIRIAGINSGMDTEAMVQELVKSYSGKTEKIKKEQTKAEWKQDAYKAMNTKVKNFYNKQLSNLQYSAAYNKKKTSVSDSSKLSVVTGDNAVNGSQTVEVKQLAKAGYLTGGKLASGANGNTKLSDLGFTGGDENGETEITLKKGGTDYTFKVTGDTTVNDFVNQLSSRGLNANFDSGTGRIFVSSKESGEATNFDLTANSPDGFKALSAFGMGKAQTGQATSFSSGTTLADVMQSAGSTYFNEHDSLGFTVNGETITADKNDTIESFLAKLNEKGAGASFDADTGKITFNAGTTLSGSDENGDSLLSALGIGAGQTAESGYAGGATKVDGQDAKILLNGAEFTSKNNSFNVNGLTLTAKDVTKEPISITTDTDYDSIYDTIKEFVKEYDSLINELDKLYNADTAKGFEPLTSEEKDALTDEEIEKWEEKIKSSLLRRDSAVSTVANAMKNAMSSVYEVNGKKLSLSNFGIETLGYFNSADNERNAYHIAGDPDDEATSGQTDKLKAAIATDPKEVASFFQKLASDMYSRLQKETWSTAERSYGNFYDDKKVKEEYESYETKLADWEEYVGKIEDKYYKQFSRMETSMAKLNNQQNYLSTMYGM